MHPLAPKEVQASFDAFLTKFSTAAGASAASGGASAPAAGAIPLYKQSSKPADFEDWEAPAYLWQQREFSDAEIDAVMVSTCHALLRASAGGSRIAASQCLAELTAVRRRDLHHRRPLDLCVTIIDAARVRTNDTVVQW